MGTQSLQAVLVDEQDVELAEAEVVHASVRLGSGHVRVEGGAEHLMHARFEYSDPQWKPEVEYHVTDGVGYLDVRQPSLTGMLTLPHKCTWNLALGNVAPVDLNVRLGSGNADVDLDQTGVTSLNAAVGSGGVEVSGLEGSHRLTSIALKAGSGRAVLNLVGSYEHLEGIDLSNASGVNEVHLRGVCPELRHLKVSGASGRTVLDLGGDLAALESAAVNTASGTVDIDLSDGVAHDLSLKINCVSGVASVRYAANVGISAHFSSVTGRVEAPALHRVGGRYVSDAYEAAEAHINLTMSSVSGKLILQPAE